MREERLDPIFDALVWNAVEQQLPALLRDVELLLARTPDGPA